MLRFLLRFWWLWTNCYFQGGCFQSIVRPKIAVHGVLESSCSKSSSNFPIKNPRQSAFSIKLQTVCLYLWKGLLYDCFHGEFFLISILFAMEGNSLVNDFNAASFCFCVNKIFLKFFWRFSYFFGKSHKLIVYLLIKRSQNSQNSFTLIISVKIFWKYIFGTVFKILNWYVVCIQAEFHLGQSMGQLKFVEDSL